MYKAPVFLAFLLLSILGHPLQLSSQAPTITAATVAGLSFRTIGPANMSGRIVDVAVVESNTATFYAASATGGLWKTTDNGTTFAPVFFNEPVASLGCVTVSQTNPTIVWVGTGEATNRQSSGWGDGVYKSTDAGRTWSNMGLRDSHHIGRIVLHPTNPDIVYVAALGHLWGPNKERGLFKSTDGGRTWKPSLQIDEDTGVSDVAMDPSDPNILYAAAHQRRRRAYGYHGGGPGNALYKSTDGGDHWTKLTSGPAGGRARTHRHFHLSKGSAHRLRLRRAGAPLQRVDRIRGAQSGRLSIERQGRDMAVHERLESRGRPTRARSASIRTTTSAIYMVSYSYSDNGGETFISPRQSLHGDDRMVWIDPHDSRHVIKADDGGLGISYDRGVEMDLCDVAARQPVVPRRGRHAEAVLGVRRPAGQRLLARPERDVFLVGHLE